VFGIRIATPAVPNAWGALHALGELRLGGESIQFLVDLSTWQIADYERQWRSAIDRLAHGAPSTALLRAYRGPFADSHVIWALWRDDDFVYVQEQAILASELDAPFDPMCPDSHVGARLDPAATGLPLVEWRVPLLQVLAAAFGFHWLFPH
jgi:hypothetical protein